ncbi:MAG: class I SAM-dependent methyltransferase [Candidatus Delongbacteria bacterium]|nr:class I SAM-dependent methyltransferase [Candidatus Delongbacteria bacterium]MCG2760901.1 class I SAM-dependent methyltransferase [Candidatus Delongbacteria bacterium]
MDLHDYDDIAENYDLYTNSMFGNNSKLGDSATINFHLELAKKYGHGDILDIACGTGLTAIPLAKNNFSVTAIDISQPMINKLNEKAKSENIKINSVCSNMCDFKLKQNFSFAFIARAGFMHLLTNEDQKNSLKNIHDHLLPKGILSLNTFYPHHEVLSRSMKSDIEDYSLRVEYSNCKGNIEKIYNSNAYDPETQIMTGQWKFEEYQNGEIINSRVRPLKIRMSFKYEMINLLELTGFRIIDVYGNYGFDPAKYPGWLVWIVEKV